MGILCGNFGTVWALGTPLDDTQNPSIVALLTAVDQGNQKHKIADTIISEEIFICDAPASHAHLNGAYTQVW